jgi:hypothetical protein
MMIDGIKSFVTGVATGKPVLRAEAVHEFTERIVNPRPVRKDMAAVPAAAPPAAWEEEKTQPIQSVSRARAIFDASEEAKPFDPADFDFAMVEDEAAVEAFSAAGTNATAAESLSPASSPRKRVLGMTSPQWMVIAALGAALLCVIAAFAYLVITSLPILP